MNFPFEQYIKEGKMIRVFTPDVPVDELKWHQDLKDRSVEILESGNWFFQTENELPKKLNKGDKLFIPKMTWHRVLKGSDKLIVEIEELDQ